MKKFENLGTDKCLELLEKDYQDIEILEHVYNAINKKLINSILNMMDTLAIRFAGHSFKSCIKIINIKDDIGRNSLKQAIISIGWGEVGKTSSYYYATYYVSKDTLYLEHEDIKGYADKRIENASSVYAELLEEQMKELREYVSNTYARFN